MRDLLCYIRVYVYMCRQLKSNEMCRIIIFGGAKYSQNAK